MKLTLKLTLIQMQGLIKGTSIVAGCVCAILYGLAVYQFAANAPFADDFDAILGFLNLYQESSLSSNLNQIFAQHNEHRIAFNKIILIIYFSIFKKINFSDLIFIGNFGWFASIYLLWCYSRKYGIKLYQFMPVIIILLTFTHYNLMTWAMASIALYYQILFALLSIYGMVNQRPFLAILFFILGLFTVGGGFAVTPILLFFYALHRQLHLFGVALLTVLSGLIIYFFIFPYISPAGYSHPLVNLLNPITIFKFFFVFLGSFVKESPLISGFCGALITGLFLNYRKSFYRNVPYLWWIAIFIFLIDVLLSITRSGFGIDQAASSRYSQYSLLMISIIYIGYLNNCTSERGRIQATGVGLIFAVILFKAWYPIGVEYMKERSQSILQNPLNTYYDLVSGQLILDKSKALGIYEIKSNP